MSDKYTYKFCVKFERGFGLQFGIAFNINPKTVHNKREIYLVIALGTHYLTIGYMGMPDDEPYEYE